MAGLRNEATLSLNITVNKDKGVSDVKRELEAIANVMKAQKFVEGMDGFNKALKSAQAAVSKLTAENKKLKAELSGKKGPLNDAHVKSYIDAEKKRAAAIKASGAEAKRAGADILSAGVRRKNQLNEEIERTRALDAFNRQNNDRHVQAYRVLEEAAKRKADAEKRAAVEAAAAAKRTAVQEKAMVAERAAGLRVAIAAATREHALATARKMAAAMAKQGNDFIAKNRNLYVQLSNAVNQNTQTVVRNNNAAKQMFRAWGQAQRQLRTSSGFVDRFSKALSQAEQKMDALFRASFRLSIVGHTLRRFSDTIIRFGSDILNVYEEFEYTMLRAAGALEIWMDATWDGTRAFDVLRDRLVGLSEELKLFAAKDVAEALYFWGSATGQVVKGVDDLEIAMSGLDTIMKASAMTNTGYEATIKGVYSILTQYYSGSLEKTTEVTEKLFLSTQKTAAEFNDLIQSFKMVGPVAAQLGADFDQVNEAFGLLSDLGLRGSMAGRGLRQLFIQMARPSGPATAKLRELFENNPINKFDGQTFREVVFPEGKFIGITNLMTKLTEATEHQTEADRLQSIARITTANSLPLVTALMSRQRNELLGLTEVTNKFTDAQGNAVSATEYFRKNWEALDNSWRAARMSLERMVEGIKITLGAQMAATLEPLIARFNEFLKAVQDFVKLNPQLVQIATNFGAILAVGSAVAGVLFIIGGALVGLFAAIRLVWDATEQWRGVLGRLITALSMLFLAVVDNFEYLRNSAMQIVENLSEAFDDVTVSGEDFLSALNDITRPAREILGLLIRIAADISVLASELIKAASSIEGFSGLMSTAITLLSAFVSAKILAGLWNLVKGFVTLNGAVQASMVSEYLRMFSYHLKAIGSAGVIASLKGVAAGLRSIALEAWRALGPVGMIAFVASLFIITDTLPVVGDAVDSVTERWRNLNNELAESSGYFENAGDSLAELAKSFSPGVDQIESMSDALWDANKEVNAFLKSSGLDQAIEGVFTPNMDPAEAERLWQDISEAAAAVFKDAGTEEYKAWQELVENRKRAKQQLDSANSTMLMSATDFTDEWKASHADLIRETRLAGKQFEMSTADYGRGLRALGEMVQPRWNLLGPSTPAGSIVDDVMNYFMGSLGDKFTIDELQASVDDVNKVFGPVLAENFTLARAISITGTSRIAAISSANESAIMDLLQQQMSNLDVADLRNFLTQPNALFGGISPMNAIGNNKDFGNAQPMLEAILAHYTELSGNLALEGAAALEPIESMLKNTLELMTVSFFQNAFPNAEDVAVIMQDLVVGNNAQDYEALADMFLTEMVGTERLIDALKSGKVSGNIKTSMVSIAQMLVEQGYGSKEFKNAVAKLAEDAGNKGGDTAKESFVKGLTDALGEGLDKKELKKLAKLGTTVEQIGKILSDNKQYRKIAFGKNQSRQSRQAYMEMIRGEISVVESSIEQATSGGQKKKRILKFVKSVIPRLGDMPKQERNAFIKSIIRVGGVSPNVVTNAIISSLPEGSNLRNRILNAILPEPEEATVSKWATNTWAIATKHLIATGQQQEVEYDPLSSIGQGGNKPEQAQNPFAEVIESLLKAAPDIPGVTTAAINLGQDILTVILGGLKAVKDDEEALQQISSFLTLLSAGVVEEDEKGWFFEGAGKDLGLNSISGFIKSITDDTTMSAAVETKAANVASALAKNNSNNNGWSVGSAWIDGMVKALNDGVERVNRAAEKALAALKGESPPKVGPLRHIDKWGQNVGNAWAEGLASGMKNNNAFRGLKSEMKQFTGKDISTNNKREIKVKLEVTSPDGTVNRQKQADIRRGALEALTAAGLEHYVTVG